jgi:hypothetical protein
MEIQRIFRQLPVVIPRCSLEEFILMRVVVGGVFLAELGLNGNRESIRVRSRQQEELKILESHDEILEIGFELEKLITLLGSRTEIKGCGTSRLTRSRGKLAMPYSGM